MMASNKSNNLIEMTGTVISDLELSHELHEETFHVFTLSIPRLSDKTDDIQVTVSDKVLAHVLPVRGMKLSVRGQLRSYNKFESGRNRLILTVFAREVETVTTDSEEPNYIQLEGYICKKPKFRTTPFGREIADLLVAVNRAYKKSDYIPMIAWGQNARFAEHFAVGDKIRVEGRFQSRTYQKCFGPDKMEVCTAYEVSVSRVQLLDLKEHEGAEVDCEEGMFSRA